MNFFYWFISAQALIAITYFLCRVLDLRSRFSEKLRLHYQALGLIFTIMIAQIFVPIQSGFQALPKSWTEFAPKTQSALPSGEDPTASLRTMQTFNHAHSLFTSPSFFTWVLFSILMLWIAFQFFRELQLLTKIKNGAFLVKKIGRVQILAHDQVPIPLTYWTFTGAKIVVPTQLLGNTVDYRISVLHELQHQRQGDPLWMFGLQILKNFCFFNPVAKMWIQKISELQEFACDETLIGRSKVNSRQYARCLLQAAETALCPEYMPVCATGLLFRMERNQLKRRIQMLLSKKESSTQKRSKTWPKLFVVFILIGGAAYTSKSIAQNQTDRTITSDDARAMVGHLTNLDGMPIAINDEVIQELNAMLNTPAKRQAMKDAVTRFQEQYQPQIETMLSTYQLPKALEAMPLVESRYQNLKQSGSMNSAGLWQFIPSTARRMGLVVDAKTDERLNVEKLNQAAGRLLESNRLIYDDAGLSILAFNWGDQRVDQLIKQLGTRDPWELSRANHHDHYLPKIVAAAIIIANPDALD